MRQLVAIVAMCIAFAVGYGIVHDQFTIRVSLEYFTLYHPRIIESRNPTALALAWGIVATWWVGAAQGLALCIASRAGSRPKLNAADLVVYLLGLAVLVAATALAAGIACYRWASNENSFPPGESDAITYDPRLYAAWAAHVSAYAAAGVGTLALCAWLWHLRGRRMKAEEET